MNNKSIIISYRESSEERRKNLEGVLDYLSHLQDGKTEILIIEQDDIPKLNWLKDVRGNEFIKHIFVQNNGIFNKGWGYNIGAKIAETDVLIFSDSDLVIKPQTYNIALKSLAKYDVVNPYQSVVFLDEETTKIFKEHKYSFSVANKFKPVIHGIITGGIFFMKKKTYIDLKGFDEDCYGYGHEDDILDEKIRKMDLSVHTLNDVSIHMYHETSDNNSDVYYSFVEVNKQLFAEYKDFSKQDLANKIANIEVWGDVTSSVVRDTSIRHIKRELYEKTSEKVTDYLLSKFTDDFLDEIVSNISTKIYNDIVDVITEKVKYELNAVKYSADEKQGMIRQIMRKFKL